MFFNVHKKYIQKAVVLLFFCLSFAIYANESVPKDQTINNLIKMNKMLEKRVLKLEQALQKINNDKNIMVKQEQILPPQKIVPIVKNSEPTSDNGFSMAFHGYVKADMIYDLGAKSGDRINYGAIPLNGSELDEVHGHYRMHARESRINFKTSINTAYGLFNTTIEGDFYGGGTTSPSGSEVISNSANFRLRHAYAEVGSWLFGQTWSNYVDVASFPENLDFSNDTGQAFLRQSQLRYTVPYKGVKYSLSLENPEADFIDDIGEKRANGQDSIPDITGKLFYKKHWGHVSLQGVYRQLTVNNSSFEDSTNAFGLGISGEINIVNNDHFRFHLSTGDGIGRYIQEAANTAAVVSSANTSDQAIATQKAFGGYIAYQHHWSDNVRSNFNLGFLSVDWNKSLLDTSLRESQNQYFNSYHANVIWTLFPKMDVGFEISKAEREQVNGAKGEVNRLQLSAKFKF